jgi:hypothetical protein
MFAHILWMMWAHFIVVQILNFALIAMIFKFPKEMRLIMEVSEYHLILNLNGILVATREGQITRACVLVLKLGLT